MLIQSQCLQDYGEYAVGVYLVSASSDQSHLKVPDVAAMKHAGRDVIKRYFDAIICDVRMRLLIAPSQIIHTVHYREKSSGISPGSSAILNISNQSCSPRLNCVPITLDLPFLILFLEQEVSQLKITIISPSWLHFKLGMNPCKHLELRPVIPTFSRSECL